MFGNITFTNNQAVTYDFNTDINPVHNFDVIADMRTDTSREKAQAHGEWPTPTYRNGMDIEFQFDLLADDMTDYVSKRKTLMAALYGSNYTGLVSEYQMGTLTIPFTGEAESWDADVMIKECTGPKTWTEGSYSTFMITFHSFTPYFVGHTTPANKYRWS